MDTNYINYKMPDEIAYSFLNFNGFNVAVWEWISIFTPHFNGHYDYLSVLRLNLNRASKKGPLEDK